MLDLDRVLERCGDEVVVEGRAGSNVRRKRTLARPSLAKLAVRRVAQAAGPHNCIESIEDSVLGCQKATEGRCNDSHCSGPGYRREDATFAGGRRDARVKTSRR